MLALVVAGGCETLITPDPDDAVPVLAVDAEWTAGEGWSVQVERTVGLNEPLDSTWVSDATVVASGPAGQTTTFVHGTRGGYVGGGSPSAGESYVLGVSAPGLPSVRSACTVPSPVEGLRVEGAPGGGLSVRFSDPAGRGDNYVLTLEALTATGDTLGVVFETDNPSIRDESFWTAIQGSGNRATFSLAPFGDAQFDGKTFEAVIVPSVSAGTDVRSYEALLNVGNRAYVEWWRELVTRSDANPFAEAAVPYSNIEGGVGSLRCRTTQRAAVTLQKALVGHGS
ncbi:DUF4249 family protein [Rubrivirga sp.]|uniref:DUF4249 family protein n=1 Tax=Rubrivirga sp. TaxID=1885344 RepID=UPI003B51D142